MSTGSTGGRRVSVISLTTRTKPTWQEVAQRRKQEILSAIPQSYLVAETLLKGHNFIDLPKTCGVLTEREIEITELNIVKLLERIHDRTYSSVEVATAFCKRAAIAHQAVRAS
jgi:amidase